MIKPKAIPPSPLLMKLADRVNTNLRDGAKIHFFHWEWPDGRPIQTGIQFSFMRNTMTRIIDTPPDHEDVDMLVSRVNSWVESVPAVSKWTTDQADADRMDWG